MLEEPISLSNLLIQKPDFRCVGVVCDPNTYRILGLRASDIKFSDVVLGQRFYDPISAEYFVKLTANMAAMVTGIGGGTVPDEFEADDVVGIEQ